MQHTDINVIHVQQQQNVVWILTTTMRMKIMVKTRKTLFREFTQYYEEDKIHVSWRTWWILTFWPVVIFGIMNAIVIGAFFISRSIERTTCHNFGEQTGFKTKMVILNWAD